MRCLLAILLALAAAAEANAQADFKVTLLGTASPSPRPTRFGPSTLVEAGDQKLLFDAGRGVPIRMWQIKVPMGKLDALFITHFHSDHVSGIPDLWLTGWLGAGIGTPLRPVWGDRPRRHEIADGKYREGLCGRHQDPS